MRVLSVFFGFLLFVASISVTFAQKAYAGRKKPDRVVLQLNWRYQFEFAGYIAAKEKGFYAQKGLDVIIKQYAGGSVVKDVLSGKADFGVAGSSLFAAMIRSAMAGKPLVMLANFFKRSPLVLAVKPYIFVPSELNEKIIMANENEFWFTSVGLLLKKFHIKPKKIVLVKGAYSIAPFIRGNVDAIAVYLTNQIYQLNDKHINYNIIDPANYGIFAYAGNLFTSEEELKKHPDLVRRFVEATVEGWKYAIKHKSELVKIIYEKYSRAKDLGALTYEANAIEGIMMPDVFPVGYIDRNVVRNIINEFEDIMGIRRRSLDIKDLIYAPSAENMFTDEDLSFIARHKVIRICTNPDWVPIEYVKDGKPEGILISVLKKVLSITGQKFVRVPTSSWAQSQEFLKRERCDLLPSAVETRKRDKYAIFTKPYMHYELFIFARNDRGFVNGIEQLLDKPMARKKGSGLIAKLKRIYPNIKIIETDSYGDDFRYVEEGKAYYTVSTLPVADYYIRKYGLKDIVIIGDTGMSYDLRMAVRNDMPMLVDVLNKALGRITKSTVDKIYMQQMSNIERTRYNYMIVRILAISTASLAVLLLIIYFVHRTNQRLRKIKRRLEEALVNFQTLINSTIQAIIVYNEKGICIDANEVACRMLGYRKDELVGKGVVDLFSKNSKVIVLEKMKEEHTQPYEVEFVKKDGSIVYALAKGDYITINGRKVRVGSAVDITRIKQLQEELNELNRTLEKRIEAEVEKNREKETLLMQQSKLASMGEMLSMIAHQWRQPLNIISANINTLMLKAELGSVSDVELKEKLAKIMEYVKHLSSTIDDFRNFFRPDKEKEKVNVEELIQNTLKIVREHIESKGISIEMDISYRGEIHTYPNELKHVILNLLNNARDALIEKNVSNPRIRISVYNDNGKLFIEVEDNAGGIKEELIDRIFEPYFTTKSKKEGTGLGLYISRIIVEGHLGGRIYAENGEEGARFTIVLPL